MVGYVLAGIGVGAMAASLDYVFPNRLEEMRVLQGALDRNPGDGAAAYLLGNFMYDRRRYAEAIDLWERATAIDPSNSVSWRNLGIAHINFTKDPDRALDAYDQARAADPADARVLFERDQLCKVIGVNPRSRLDALEAHPEMILDRDDLALEVCELYNATGQPERAEALLSSRTFAPWEGGEGITLRLHGRAHTLLARRAAARGESAEAVRLLRLPLSAPINLGEARHLLANASDLWIALGDALRDNGGLDEARRFWRRAAEFRGDFQNMSVQTFSEMTYYRALGLKRIGRDADAATLLHDLAAYAEALELKPAKIDYFATSLTSRLPFHEDLQERQTTSARFLAAQAALGLGDTSAARRLLEDVLHRDPNHAPAQDLLEDIT
jgi:tetratricopeptide (TPR) repeat protein